MADDEFFSEKYEYLRKQAEELIQYLPSTVSSTPSIILELLYELKIIQIELLMQNEELKRAQAEIASVHREYERLYQQAPCGFLSMSPNGIVTRANSKAVNLLGTTSRMLSNSTFSKFIAPGWENIYLQARLEAEQTGERQCLDLPLKSRLPDALWIQLDIEPDIDETGALIQWRMSLVDITKRKLVEEALIRTREEAEEARKSADIASKMARFRGPDLEEP